MPNAQAASAALAVLGVLSRHTEPLPAAAIAREVGLPRSSTYHLLRVLTDHGYVVHLPDERRYGLGVAAFELGSAYQRQAPLQRMARPILTRLVDDTTHNGHFAVLHGRDVLYVVEERAAGRPFLVTDVGIRLPAPLTASGLAILAALPGPQVRALFPAASAFVDLGGGGPTTLRELRSQLVETRRRGYALESGTVTPGLMSVAQAAVDHTGHPVAAFALTFDPDAVPESTRVRLGMRVGSAADALTRRLTRRP